MILQSASISRTSDTLVFAPTFNERQTIGPLLDDLLSLPGRFDVLIVDDLSCDGTAEYLTGRAATDPRLRLIMRPGKFGVGSAHKLAWLQARQHGYSRLVTLDADLSHDPQDVSRVLASTGVQMLRSDRDFCRVAVLTTAAGPVQRSFYRSRTETGYRCSLRMRHRAISCLSSHALPDVCMVPRSARGCVDHL